MSLPDINFENIRPIDGSRSGGFEELCCQLAALEEVAKGESFHRKGHGGDAGVECYRRRADGTEVGWQAKYLFLWSSGLNTQLNDSIRRALDQHRSLVEYVVCLPFDLSDSRTGKRKTAREKWVSWCRKWKRYAATQGRDLKITLWGKSELSTRLTRDDPAYLGRLLYWFGREALTAEWFKEQFGKTSDSLGSRYTPETNVELPIRQDFLAFARHPELQKQIDGWFFRITEKGSNAVDAIRRTGTEADRIHSDCLDEAIRALTSLLDGEPIGPDRTYPTSDWSTAASNCLNIARNALNWTYALPPSKPHTTGVSSERSAQHTLHELIEVLREVTGALVSNRWKLTNAKAVLLQGHAGIGKSHLLADIVEHHLHTGGPGLLLLGAEFIDNELWPQIRDRLDLPPTEQFKHFLGSLDAAAQAVGMRAIFSIDALNERNGIYVWPERIKSFLKTIEAFPRVGVIVSCRTPYVPYLIPDDVDEERLFRMTHRGFAGNGGEAARIYLDKRGMVRPGAPGLVPEFDNPLFLKICCDSLQKDEKPEFPKGLRGVTSIFNFYFRALTKSLNRRMKLDAHLEIVPQAVKGLARLLADSGRGHAMKREAVTLFESIHASEGSLERSLLAQLESEGLLTVEPMRQNDGSIIEMVRFTFERFSDHQIASRLLDDHINCDDISLSFKADHPLHLCVFGPESYERPGIIEAIAIQLPERTGIEILDTAPEAPYVVHQAFLNSLVWREQSNFTDRTLELLKELVETHELNDVLISISTEPSNKFNAIFLHKRLMKMSMPERDKFWSLNIAEIGFEGSIKTLISWALQNELKHLDDDRAYLAATMLTWLFTTSHREIRDKATKSLANILCRRLTLGARLVRDFEGVNDPYVYERLLAACYGAALQGIDRLGLSELAYEIFRTIFADKQPPVNALLRDHARGIVEYAEWRGAMTDSTNHMLARPPYQSPWPIEPVPDKLIESYTEDYGHGIFRDAIVSSSVSSMGDFAKYVIDDKVTRWSPANIGTITLPTLHDICEDWKLDFLRTSNIHQQNALTEYISAANEVKHIHDHQSTQKLSRFEEAERTLRQTMTSDQWEDFRVRARDCLRYNVFTDKAAKFDVRWCCRWICKRAHELGWESGLFGDFDNRLSGIYQRHNRVERIGKKYQWLALHELVARMGDNLALLDSPQRDEGKNRSADWIARIVGLRDIDPSLLTTRTHYDGWREWGKTWWVPIDPHLRAMAASERLAWLESGADIVSDSTLIDLCNPKTDRRWLALSGFSNWRGYGVRNGKKELQREAWFRLTCIVVHRKDQSAMIESLYDKILTHPHSFPRIEFYSRYNYLGEYPWHPHIEELDCWISHDGWQKFAAPIRPTVARYICEGGSYDYSVDQTICVEIPAPWLSKSMGTQFFSGRSPVFVNSDGQEMFYDPSVVEPGPAAGLVDHDIFLQVLDRQGFSAIWVIAGEKNVFGGRDASQGFGGSLRYTAIYHLDDGIFTCHLHTDRIHPSTSQLREFFGTDPVPIGIETRSADQAI